MSAATIPDPTVEESEQLLAFTVDLVAGIDRLLAAGVHPQRLTFVLDELADSTRTRRPKRK
jgi:hypothetical protein